MIGSTHQEFPTKENRETNLKGVGHLTTHPPSVSKPRHNQISFYKLLLFPRLSDRLAHLDFCVQLGICNTTALMGLELLAHLLHQCSLTLFELWLAYFCQYP